jgi:glycosyltransferase involved in cell wall biosynthesis
VTGSAGGAFARGNVPADVLILGTAEWDAPIATNQHYIVRELSHAANVTFVESLGLRRPSLRRDDLVRMIARVGRAFGGRTSTSLRAQPAGTTVISPIVIPIHRAPTRTVNRLLLRRATAKWLASDGPRVLWTFTPVTYGLEAMADVVVYHCVDLLGSFPGVDSVAVARGERRLASQAALTIATSKAVEEHLRACGFDQVTLLPNVADTSVFENGSKPAVDRRPAVLFAGNLSLHKLDAELLESIAEALRGKGDLLLAGPLGAGGGSFDSQLRRLEGLGARYLGVLATHDVAEIAGTCMVGLIPYAINDYTRGVSPLKCFEYLASGLAVLATGLPSITELSFTNPDVVQADRQGIAAQIHRLLAAITDEDIARRRKSASGHGWGERGQLIRDLLAHALAERRSPAA